MPDTTIGKAARYRNQIASMWTDRSTFDEHWREIARLVRPRRSQFLSSNRTQQGGENGRHQDIIDSTATIAARTCESGLQAGLTSPVRPWFKLTTPDPAMTERQEVKTWLHTVTQRMSIVFSRSNLYNALPTVYGDFSTFGTAAVAVLEDDDSVLRAFVYPIGSYAITVDRKGRVAVFAHRCSMSVQQLVEEYGGDDGATLIPGQEPDLSRFSDAVQKAYTDGRLSDKVEVGWIVQPNRKYEPETLGGDAQWRFTSCHFEMGSMSGTEAGPQPDQFLRESGFYEMPVFAPRWSVTSSYDDYGTDCPGMTVLGDVRQLQAQQKTKGRALQKMVDPPLQAPSHAMTQKVSLLPADITYVDAREQSQGIRPLHEVSMPIGDLTRDIYEGQFRIKRGYFEDLFLMLAQSDQARGSQPVTAREIDERHEEKLLALGPVLERTNDELLNPLIDRTYALMQRADMIPSPPEILDGVDLPVEYTSILAQAMKEPNVRQTDRFVQAALVVAQAWPEAGAKVDAMQVIDEYADSLGINPKLVRSDEDAGAIMQRMAEQQQRAQQMLEQESQAKSMQALSNASLEGESVLARMARQGQPQQRAA